jgi:O-6-methylguanine DNA methyltransferase
MRKREEKDKSLFYCKLDVWDYSVFIVSSEVGLVTVQLNNNEELLLKDIESTFPQAKIMYSDEYNNIYSVQLTEYFRGLRKEFSLPLDIKGTDFQMKVWNALLKIPYGSVTTYKGIAERIDNPKGQRAVGLANNKNKIPIVIPCHRVIGTNGKLVGYEGGVHLKEKLLQLEGLKIVGEKVVI